MNSKLKKSAIPKSVSYSRFGHHRGQLKIVIKQRIGKTLI